MVSAAGPDDFCMDVEYIRKCIRSNVMCRFQNKATEL